MCESGPEQLTDQQPDKKVKREASCGLAVVDFAAALEAHALTSGIHGLRYTTDDSSFLGIDVIPGDDGYSAGFDVYVQEQYGPRKVFTADLEQHLERRGCAVGRFYAADVTTLQSNDVVVTGDDELQQIDFSETDVTYHDAVNGLMRIVVGMELTLTDAERTAANFVLGMDEKNTRTTVPVPQFLKDVAEYVSEATTDLGTITVHPKKQRGIVIASTEREIATRLENGNLILAERFPQDVRRDEFVDYADEPIDHIMRQLYKGEELTDNQRRGAQFILGNYLRNHPGVKVLFDYTTGLDLGLNRFQTRKLELFGANDGMKYGHGLSFAEYFVIKRMVHSQHQYKQRNITDISNTIARRYGHDRFLIKLPDMNLKKSGRSIFKGAVGLSVRVTADSKQSVFKDATNLQACEVTGARSAYHGLKDSTDVRAVDCRGAFNGAENIHAAEASACTTSFVGARNVASSFRVRKDKDKPVTTIKDRMLPSAA